MTRSLEDGLRAPTAPASAGAPAPAARSLERMVYLVFVLFAAAYMVGMFNTKYFLGDEGVAALNAWRIGAGQVPHRDFFEIVPPASFLPLALAFKFFGASVVVERSVVLLLALAVLFSADRLLRCFTTDVWARCLAASTLAPFGVNYWPLPSHHWLADLFQVLALICLFTALKRGRPLAWGAAAGALCALACFSLQDQGGYFLLALCLLFFPWLGDASLRRRLWLGWVLGGLAVGGAFALYLLPRTGVTALAEQWFVFPMGHYKQIGGNASSFFAGWDGIAGYWTSGQALHRPLYCITMAVSWGFVFCLPWLALLALVYAALKRLRPLPELGLMAAAWIAFVAAALHRWSFTNIIWTLPACIVPAAWGLSLALAAGRRWQRTTARMGLALVLGSISIYGILILMDARPDRSSPVHGRAGTVRSLVPEESALFQQAVTAVEAHVPAGSPLFTSGFIPLVNFLTSTTPPTRYNFFMYPAYNTEEQVDEVLRALEVAHVQHALLVRPVEPGNRLSAYFLERFRPVWSNGVAVLYERKPEAVDAAGVVPSSPVQPPAGAATAR